MTITGAPVRRQFAFTLVELLVGGSVTAMLVFLIVASTTRTREESLQMACLKNLRHLQEGLAQYMHDHDGDFPHHHGIRRDGQWWTVRGWVTGNALASGTLDSLQQGALYRYIDRPAAYRCPADRSKLDNSERLRLRSYSLNLHAATDYPNFNARNEADIEFPARIFAFIDEDAGSINEAMFAVYPAKKRVWWDRPADRHRQGGTLSFLDGHVEYWKWNAPKAGLPFDQAPSTPTERDDLIRIQTAAHPL